MASSFNLTRKERDSFYLAAATIIVLLPRIYFFYRVRRTLHLHPDRHNVSTKKLLLTYVLTGVLGPVLTWISGAIVAVPVLFGFIDLGPEFKEFLRLIASGATEDQLVTEVGEKTELYVDFVLFMFVLYGAVVALVGKGIKY